MKNLRQEIREGKTPENCATCWIDEDNGKESKRQLYNGYAEWRYPDGIDYDGRARDAAGLSTYIRKRM